MSSETSSCSENLFFYKDLNSVYAFSSEKSLIAFRDNHYELPKNLANVKLSLPNYQCDMVDNKNKTFFSETKKYNIYEYVVVNEKEKNFVNDLTLQDIHVSSFENIHVYKKLKSTFSQQSFIVPFFSKNHLELNFPDGNQLYAAFKPNVDIHEIEKKHIQSIKSGIHGKATSDILVDLGTVDCESKSIYLQANEFKLKFNPASLGNDSFHVSEGLLKTKQANKFKWSLSFLIIASNAFKGDLTYGYLSLFKKN